MPIDAVTAVVLFLAGQTICAVYAFATLRADTENLKAWVKEIACDTKATALRVAAINGENGKWLDHKGE
jgi:hypothetical protein